MKAYRIVDWVRWFEVKVDGHETKTYEQPPGTDKLRKSPLDYIRLRGNGHSLTTTDRRINDKAYIPGQLNELAAKGLYWHLCMIAKQQSREYRGWVLDDKQRPMGAKEIAEVLGFFDNSQIRAVEKLLGVLTDPEVDLLELCEYRQTCARMRTNAHESETLKTETESNIKESKYNGLFSKNDVSVSGLRKSCLERVIRALRINPKMTGDITTIRDIFDQISNKISSGRLSAEIYELVAQSAENKARVSTPGKKNNPLAMFIAEMGKEPFGYVAAGKTIRGNLERVLARIRRQD